MPNLKIGPDDFTGGSGKDNYFAQVKVSGGNRLNTLETGDRIDGRGNFDTLDAELSNEDGGYFVRPTLISVEKARFSVTDNDGDGVTVNLNQSEDLKTIVNYQSLGDLTLNNVDDVQKFYWKNGESGDFEVNDISSDFYSFEITNTGEGYDTESKSDYLNLSIDGDEARRATFILEDAFVDIESNNYVNYARLTVSNSQIDLNVNTNKISFESLDSVNGEDTSNAVYFDYFDPNFTRFVVTGDSFIDFTADGSIDIDKVFDASDNSGGVEVGADITGSFKRLSGSTGDDSFDNITSDRAGDVRLGFRGGDLDVDVITANNATEFYVNTSTEFGESSFIDGIVSSSTAAGATVRVLGGDGGDEIGGYVSDMVNTVIIPGGSQGLAVEPEGPGLSITGTATTTVDMGAGQDVLRISNLYNGANNTVDMGNGMDVLDVSDANDGGGSGTGLNFNDEGGTEAVTTLDGGAGDDTLVAEFQNGFASGNGDDTVANTVGQIVNFETLVLAQDSGGTFDMDALEDVETVELGQGGFSLSDQDGGTYEFLNVNAGTTYLVNEAIQTSAYDAGGDILVGTSMPTPVDLTLHADTGVTETTVQMGDVLDTEASGGNTYNADVHLDGFTTLNVLSEGPHLTGSVGGPYNYPVGEAPQIAASMDGQDTYNVVGLTDDSDQGDVLTTINISGPENIAIDIHGDAVDTVDASDLSGDLDLTNSEFTQSVTITGGSGDDILIGSEQADTFNLGEGGDDLILFNSADDSDLGIGQSDTVNGFVGGSLSSGDKFVFNSSEFGEGNPNFTATMDGYTGSRAYTQAEASSLDSDNGSGTNDILVFLGNADTFAQAQAAVATNDIGEDNHQFKGAVYDTSTNTLYIDVDSDGDLDADDFSLQLDDGVDGLNARDLLSADVGSLFG